MESFSLLKYWRGGGGAALAAATASSMRTTAAATTTTIATSVTDPSVETHDDGGDGPFFDLEFAVPEEDDEGEEEDDGEEKDGPVPAMETESDDNQEREFNFMVSSEGSCGGDLRSDPLSPSDDLFF